MIPNHAESFTAPRNPILRWLADPGPGTSEEIRGALLAELFSAPTAVLAGVVNGVILNGFAWLIGGGNLFLALMLADISIGGLRVHVAFRALAAARKGLPTQTDLVFIMAILWCMVQAVMLYATEISGISALQSASVATCAILICSICVRNYAAPRYATLLFLVVDGPFLTAVALLADHWFRIMLLEAPLQYIACMTMLNRYRQLSISMMQSRFESQRAARYDPLTGLLNRAGLAEYLAALRLDEQRRFAVLYIDLDGFKAVNDSHGHAAGDKLLAEVAQRLRQVTRSSDVLARLGGDEFVIIAPDLGAEQAPDLADALIHRLGDQRYPQENGQWARIGASVGFACYPVDGTSLKQLQLAADMALYEAKRAGKGVWRRAAQLAA